MNAGRRWAGPARAATLAPAALLSLALHGAVLGGVLLWMHRTPPPEPTADRGVEIVWDEAATEAVGAAEAAEPPGVPPGAEAPELAEAAEPAAPPPSPPMPPPPLQMAAAAVPPSPAAPLDLPPAELRAPDLAVAPSPPSPESAEEAQEARAPPPPAEAPPPEPRPAPEELALPLPPPEPPRQAARARPAPARPPAPEGAQAGPEATQQTGAGIGRATGAVTPPGPDTRFQNAAPSYPEAARLRGEQGSVALELSVGTDGRVITIAVTRSSGSPMLDAAARRTVTDWRFRPATRDGEAVPGTIRTTIHFRLQ